VFRSRVRGFARSRRALARGALVFRRWLAFCFPKLRRAPGLHRKGCPVPPRNAQRGTRPVNARTRERVNEKNAPPSFPWLLRFVLLATAVYQLISGNRQGATV